MSISVSQFIPPPLPLNHVYILHLWLLFLFANKFICTITFRFHIDVMIYDYLSLSDLLHSVWQFLGPSMSLWMALFHSFYGMEFFLCLTSFLSGSLATSSSLLSHIKLWPLSSQLSEAAMSCLRKCPQDGGWYSKCQLSLRLTWEMPSLTCIPEYSSRQVRD